jgi:prostaglandin reductase 1
MLQPAIVFKQLKIEGFIVSRWSDVWQNGIERNLNLIKEVSALLLILSL